jgi:hypothetical protein
MRCSESRTCASDCGCDGGGGDDDDGGELSAAGGAALALLRRSTAGSQELRRGRGLGSGMVAPVVGPNSVRHALRIY